MMFVLTFLLVAVLETAVAHDEPEKETAKEEKAEDHDICVGCDREKDRKESDEKKPMFVEVKIDPLTGDVQYVIKGIVIE